MIKGTIVDDSASFTIDDLWEDESHTNSAYRSRAIGELPVDRMDRDQL